MLAGAAAAAGAAVLAPRALAPPPGASTTLYFDGVRATCRRQALQPLSDARGYRWRRCATCVMVS